MSQHAIRQLSFIALVSLMLLGAMTACTLSNSAAPTPEPVALNPSVTAPAPTLGAQASATPAPTATAAPTSTPFQTSGSNASSGIQPISVVGTSVKYITALQTVRMRSGPGTGYSVIGQLHAGQVIAVSGISGNAQWWRVLCSNGSVGNCWVSADPTLTQPASAPGQPGSTIPVIPAPVEAVRVLADVRIRSGPGIHYPILALLSGGQIAYVTGMSVDGLWYRIDCTHNPVGNCWITAAPSVTQPADQNEPPPYAGPVLNTPIRKIRLLRDVNVRTGPGIQYGAVSVAPAGHIALVNGISPDRLWYRIDCAPNMAGACWVQADPLLTEPHEIDDTPTDSGPVIDTPVRYVKALGNLPIHSGPGLQYQAVGMLTAGQLAKVNGITPDMLWYRIDCSPNVTGNCWIDASPAVAEPVDPSAPSGEDIPVVGTTITRVLAKEDVAIFVGAPASGNPAGSLFAGQTATVLGVTIDHEWWQVPCPGDGPAKCFVTANPAQTEASTGPGI